MACEEQIYINPEQPEQQIELNGEPEAENIGVQPEIGEQQIGVGSENDEESLEIESEKGEECIFGGHECISVSGIASYTPLKDKPSINGVELEGDLSLSDLGFDEISAEEVESILSGNEPTAEPLKYLSQYGLFVLQGVLEQLLEGKVDKEQGKGLSSNDFTTTEKNKLAGIEAGAEKNIIEAVKRNGETLPITNKTVDVAVPEKTSELTNDSDFITESDLPEIPTKTSDLTNDSGFITNSALGNYYTKTQTDGLISNEASAREQADQALAGQINTQAGQITQNTNAIQNHQTQISQNTLNLAQEQLSRQNADNNLQNQIDALTAASDVVDIVGTYAELQNYDTSSLTKDDIVKVLSDDHHDDATTYYRWNNGWTYIGSEGSSYTKAEADELFVPQTRTVNGKALSTDISLTADDVGALDADDLTPLENDIADLETNKADKTEIPTKTSDLTNDSGFIDDSALDDYYDKTETDTLLGGKQDTLTAGDNITIENNVISASGGGSQVTLYNSLGENTDGAMTQKATRQALFRDTSMECVRIGSAGTSSDYGSYTTAVGYMARTLGSYSVAVGRGALTNQGGVAIGNGATAATYNSVALGETSSVDHANSVAIGYMTRSSRANEVAIAQYNAGVIAQRRFLTGLLDGVQDDDAVNVSQLNAVEDEIPTATSDLTNDSGFITSSDIPAIPTKTSELTNDSGFITSADIPAIPTKTSDLTNDSGFITSADVPTKTSELTNDSGFITSSDVPTATSELTNDSGFITSADLPTVNDATLTIQQNGTNVATFTANSATNQTANITVPTATSDLTNDSGFITSSDLPTIDSTLSTSSTNAVENQAIANALADKYDKAGGEITGNAKVDGTFTLDINDPDYDSGINFTRTLDNNLGTTLTLTGYAGNTNYKTLLRNIATPNSDYDAANKKYVDDHILTPVNYLVALDQNGAIDLVSSSLNYATVKADLTNSTKDVYLDVLWEPSRFYVKAVQDEDTNNGPINFIGSYSRGGKFYTALFMLDSSDNLTVLHLEPQLAYEKAQAITSTNISSTTEYPTTKAVADYVAAELAPTVIYSDATGLSPLQADVSASIAYQLTNLDLSPYKRIKVHIGSGGSSGTGFKSSGLIELSLDANLANASTGQWVGSVLTENAADRNRLSAFLVAVSPDKTSFAYARATSLYGTGATNITDAYVKLIEGFKY